MTTQDPKTPQPTPVDLVIKAIEKLRPVQQLEVLQKIIAKKNISEWMELHMDQCAYNIQKKGISKKWIYRAEESGQEVIFDHSDGLLAIFGFDLNFVSGETEWHSVSRGGRYEKEVPVIKEPIFDELCGEGIYDTTDKKIVSGPTKKIIEFMKTH